KIFQSMENTLNTQHQEKTYFIDDILQDDFKCYFPECIDNEKIFTKLYEANRDCTKEKESQKNVIQTYNNDLNFYFKLLTKKTSKVNLIKSTAKLLASHVEKKLNEFTEINSAQPSQLIQKKFESSPKKENKKVIQNDLKHL
ncbi:hypothetical protein, partial [Rickettsiella grylli]|uniref:hypothetical protein n=1 Tax=Rickettsiella grylli TaxID=59196 RepID=UPI000A77D44F